MKVPAKCVVTGGNGMVGRRLVEMLVERGAERVVSLDITPAADAQVSNVHHVTCDLADVEGLVAAFQGAEVIFHIAALVGPYHDPDSFTKVNYQGSLNVLEACKRCSVRKLVFSSSPSTRFPWPDPSVTGFTEDDLARINQGPYAPHFLQPYAESKARGERAILEACSESLLTVAVAPHQVYGPRDALFLPSFLAAAQQGLLRILGDGHNKISFCHVDNYCHGLLLGCAALYPASPALGKFYIVTDDCAVELWPTLDSAIQAMGLPSLFHKTKVPGWVAMLLANMCLLGCDVAAALTGIPSYRLQAKVKLVPFSVRMLLIDRYFDISNAKRDLHYSPLVSFEQGWADTIGWFQAHGQASGSM